MSAVSLPAQQMPGQLTKQMRKEHELKLIYSLSFIDVLVSCTIKKWNEARNDLASLQNAVQIIINRIKAQPNLKINRENMKRRMALIKTSCNAVRSQLANGKEDIGKAMSCFELLSKEYKENSHVDSGHLDTFDEIAVLALIKSCRCYCAAVQAIERAKFQFNDFEQTLDLKQPLKIRELTLNLS